MRRRLWYVAAGLLAIACDDPTTPASPDATASPPTSSFDDRLFDAPGTRFDLGTLGGASSFATDISNQRVVVGWSLNAAGVNRAFRWTSSTGMRDLGTLPGHEWSRAIAVNDDGTILGLSGDADAFAGTPVTWSVSGEISALPISMLPGADVGEPTDFNRRSEVAGWDVTGSQRAWYWSRAIGKRDITAEAPGGFEGASSQINAAGTIVGSNKAPECTGRTECWRTFLWDLETGYREIGLPNPGEPGSAVSGLGLNNSEMIVGWVQGQDGRETHPYRWTRARGFALLPHGASGYATAINDSGMAVGTSFTSDNLAQAVVWPVNGDAVLLSPSDPNPQIAVAVNDWGHVAGWTALDRTGTAHHATVWVVGFTVANGPRIITSDTARRSRSSVRTARPGVESCTSDVRSLTSRGALFACLARSSGAR